MSQLAFPTAYGGGAYVTGGRGLDIYKVTNLNDSGAGSLRQAIADANTAGGGNIVFDISGVINLTSILGFGDNITIAGQTAPDGGITIDGQRVYVADADNLIVRYIRFKGGIDGGDDSVTVRNSVTNQIWDHCSFGFGDDEGASWYETQSQYSVENLTIQRCLFGENSKGSIIGTGTGGGTSNNLSFNYNLFYNNSHRFPNTAGENANIEVINNVVWNVDSRLVRTNGSGQNLNHIGNYYHFNDTGITDDRVNMFSYENGYPNIYTSGNKIEGVSPSTPLASTVAQMNADNTLSWKHFIDGTSTPQGTRNKGDQLEAEYFTSTQHALIGRSTTILDADTAFDNVRADVGANKTLNADGTFSSNLDAEDTDYLNQIDLGNFTTPLSLNATDMAVTPISSVSRAGDYYSTNQYIPETWGQANITGFSATSHTELAPSGYTWFEEYVNQVDDQQLAFPTAYGGGAYASGGRGGNVYKVTNLLDDGSVGSFRWAVTQARPATIIFDVSGTIQLASSLIVQGDDLTVAGQTAPQGGITITSNDKNIRFGISRFNSVENHIWRYIKVRAQYQGNDEYQNIQQYAGNAVTDYTRNIILDHLSISGAQYMAYSIRGEGSENVTLQNIMFGENAKTALFGDTDDLFSKDFTFRNNTMYHSTHRVPNTSAQNVDVYNNVVYDWVNRLTVIKNGTAINHFNNYYYKGTRTNLGSSWNGAPENFTWEVNGITTNADAPVTIYSKNNVIQDLYVYDDNDADITNAFQDDRYIWMHHAGQLVDGTEIIPDRQQRNKADDSYFVDNPMVYAGRVPNTFLTAEEAKTAVPNDSGAYKYLKDDGTVGEFRDALDTEYHSNIINDNATDFAYDGGVNDPINSTLFTNFVASISTTPINSRPVNFYGTNDYIPSAWLTNNGYSDTVDIHNQLESDGYTVLEHYMNQVDGATPPDPPTQATSGSSVSLIFKGII